LANVKSSSKFRRFSEPLIVLQNKLAYSDWEEQVPVQYNKAITGRLKRDSL
jgi:hypothetical protein